MKFDLLKQEIYLKHKNVDNLDNILQEAVLEAEMMFNKSLKQLCPTGEEKEFILNLVESLIIEKKNKINIIEVIKNFLKSDKSFKEFLESMTISDITSGITGGRGGLVYDTTRTMFNYKPYTVANMANDDENLKRKSKVWNKGALNKVTKDYDATADVGELSIDKDTYFDDEEDKEDKIKKN